MFQKRVSQLLILGSVAVTLASCAGVEQLKADTAQPVVPTQAPTVKDDGAVINSQGIDYGKQFSTYLNPDNDPWQAYNRKVWYFNYDILDRYILRPLALANKNYVSPDLRLALSNANSYLGQPVQLATNLFTFQPKEAGKNLSTIIINGVFGLGVIDWASELGINTNGNNFDYNLAKYGVPTGPYLMIPGYTPTYPRELAGKALNFGANTGMANLITNASTWYITGPLTIYSAINSRSNIIDQEAIIAFSPDNYPVVRSLWAQYQNYNQAKALNQTQPFASEPTFNLDDLDDLDSK